MNFRVGQKVVCVEAGPIQGQSIRSRWYRGEEIFEGTIYTVRRCFLDIDGDWIVWLEEVARTPRSRELFDEDIGYNACRFRPVVERPTDISIFTKILRDTRMPLKVD